MRPLVADVVQALSATARSLGRTIEVDVEDINVPGDVDSLLVAIRNLCDNALRHAVSRVRISARRTDREVIVSVQDEQQARAFDRFYRATAQGSGTGLGLALVKRVTDLHGGAVRLTPGLQGRGLGVEVRLPARSPSD